MIGWIYFLSCLLICVFVHELAHLFIALVMGVKINAFSIGFGKVLLHKKLWDIDFRLSVIPLGGYCQLAEKGKNNWLTKRYSKKLAIVLAGVAANLLLVFLCYYINYRSISIGFFIDFEVLKGVFAKDYDSVYRLISMVPNLFLLQLSIMNLFAAISNILPIPALDGGFIWLLLLEKKIKNFPNFLDRITKIGFAVLMIIQFLLIFYIWFM